MRRSDHVQTASVHDTVYFKEVSHEWCVLCKACRLGGWSHGTESTIIKLTLL